MVNTITAVPVTQQPQAAAKETMTTQPLTFTQLKDACKTLLDGAVELHVTIGGKVAITLQYMNTVGGMNFCWRYAPGGSGFYFLPEDLDNFVYEVLKHAERSAEGLRKLVPNRDWNVSILS